MVLKRFFPRKYRVTPTIQQEVVEEIIVENEAPVTDEVVQEVPKTKKSKKESYIEEVKIANPIVSEDIE